MNRAQMIEKAARELYQTAMENSRDEWPLFQFLPSAAKMRWRSEGAEIIDAILPQVTTVEEWAALPINSLVVGCFGSTRRAGGVAFQSDRDWLEDNQPVTVVWQP